MPKRVYRPVKTKPEKNWLRNKHDAAFYNSGDWRRLSLYYRTNHPVCETPNCTQASYYADHIIPIDDGGKKLDEDNLQALCKSCNASKTAKQSKRLK